MLKNVLTITLNPTVDKSTSLDKLAPEKKLRCDNPVFEPGGGGINVSRGLVRLGVPTTAMFPSGGRTGLLLQQLLKEETVQAMPVDVEAETRENFIVVETSTNQQYRFGMPGLPLSTAELDKLSAELKALQPFPELVIISGSLPPGVDTAFLGTLIRDAKAQGAKVIVDTSGPALELAVSEGVYLLKPNLGELARLSGNEALDNDSADEAARKLIDEGKTEIVVVSMGPQGAYLISKEECVHIPAPAVKKLSTVGAGDSMVAGMVSVLARGGSQYEMAAMGVACGSAATMNPGTGLFKKEDASRLFEWLMKRR